MFFILLKICNSVLLCTRRGDIVIRLFTFYIKLQCKTSNIVSLPISAATQVEIIGNEQTHKFSWYIQYYFTWWRSFQLENIVPRFRFIITFIITRFPVVSFTFSDSLYNSNIHITTYMYVFRITLITLTAWKTSLRINETRMNFYYFIRLNYYSANSRTFYYGNIISCRS